MKRILFLLLSFSSISYSQFTNAKSIQGKAVSSTAPSNGQGLFWNSSTGKWTPGVSGGYQAVFLSTTGFSVAASLHQQGANVWGTCFDNASPTASIVQTAGFPTVDSSGNMVFAWTGTKTGVCLISALGGSVGPQGPTGNTGNTGQAGAAGTTTNGGIDCPDATGSTTAYTCPSPNPVPASYATGALISFTPQTTNSGTTPTLNVAGLGAKNLKTAAGSNPAASAFTGGTTYILEYDGTNLRQVGSGGGVSGSTLVMTIQLPVAVAQSTTGITGLSLPAANAPTPDTNTPTGSPATIFGVLRFPAGSTTSAQYHFTLPSDIDCSSAMDLNLTWRAASITNSVTWGVQTSFVAAGSVADGLTFNTASTVAHAPQGTTLQIRTDSITGITKTGCAASKEAYFYFYRDGADTMSGDAQLLSATLVYRRTL